MEHEYLINIYIYIFSPIPDSKISDSNLTYLFLPIWTPELHNCACQQLELKNVMLRAGDQVKIKGFVLHDAERYEQIIYNTQVFSLSLRG